MSFAPPLADGDDVIEPSAEKPTRKRKPDEDEAKHESSKSAAFPLARKRKPGLY